MRNHLFFGSLFSSGSGYTAGTEGPLVSEPGLVDRPTDSRDGTFSVWSYFVLLHKLLKTKLCLRRLPQIDTQTGPWARVVRGTPVTGGREGVRQDREFLGYRPGKGGTGGDTTVENPCPPVG